MRKIPREYENPFDALMLDLCDRLPLEALHSVGVTPNMLTTLGNVSRIAAAYFLFQQEKNIFAAFYALGYLFDCMDGHFARRYQMTSEFGDVYDHASDVFTFLLYVYYIFFRSSLVGTRMYYPVVVTFLLIVFLMCMHMGCQQRYVSSDETLNTFKMLCQNPEWIRWTRFFGCGTYVLFVGILAYIY